MKYFRGNLSRLKTLVDEKIPEGPDVFGYQGISKELLIGGIEQAYDLAGEIQKAENGNQIDVISLKRKGSRVYGELKEYLEGGITKRKSEKQFNVFLDSLSELLEKTQFVYLIAAKNGFKDDQEIANLRDQISGLEKEKIEFSKSIADFQESFDSTRERMAEITQLYDEAKEKDVEFSEWVENSDSKHKAIVDVTDKIEGWDESIQENDAKFRSLSAQIEKLATESSSLKQDLEITTNTSQKFSESLETCRTKNENLVQEIKDTLGDANRVGMAASFKERKDEVEKTHKNWQRIFIIAIILISVASGYLFLWSGFEAHSNWEHVIIKITVITPLVWLAWFAAKQYGIANKVREDYSFKYACAMAYEGFKKATREANPDLEETLLEFSLFNMAQNPIRLFDIKHDKTTPGEELTDHLMERLKRVKKLSFDAPTVGRVTAEIDPVQKT